MHRFALAGATALLVVLAACSRSSPPAASAADASELPPGPIACPAAGDLTTAADVVPSLLPDEATLKAWQEYMVGLGPRFTGSPALKSWHDFMAGQLAANGLTVVREPIAIDWWYHRKWSLTLIQNGVETAIPVSAYFPYSGFTPDGGIVADVVDVGTGTPDEFAAGNVDGKIAFYQEDMLPLTAALFYGTATYVHDPDMTLSPATSFKRASVSFLTPQETTSLTSAKSFGAIGAIVSYEASPENAAGQYTPFLTNPKDSQGVPALYIDRATGDQIKALIALGAQARLELVVDEHPADGTDDIIATLPGMTDEVMIVNTHSDGTSASEENGTLGVLALAQYFASLDINCRQRTMVFVLTPGHFNNGIEGDTDRFIKHHPEIIQKAVASATIEHLGETEWVDDAEGFHPTGMFEPGLYYGSANAVQDLIKNAVVAEDLRRTFVLRPDGPIYFGVGSPLNAAGVPNAAYITGPNMMLSWAYNQHIDKVDYGRMAAEIRTATRVATEMDGTDTATLCAGMHPTNSGVLTGCSAYAQ